MFADIKQIVDDCDSCQSLAKSLPIMPIEATRPREKLRTDLFNWDDKHYLLIID